MKKGAAGLTITLVLAFAAIIAPQAGAKPPTHVVCQNNDFRTWHERVRPHQCNLHNKTGDANGTICFCHADTSIMRRIRWSRWHKGFAHGRGQLGISTVGWRKAGITLWRPRRGWAPHGNSFLYFTRAKIKGKVHGQRFQYRVQLKAPQNRRHRA